MTRGHNSPEMNFALERLAAERIRHEQTSKFQIKVGPYNFYPDKGTIYMDRDQKARLERGLEEFLALITKLRARNPRAFEYASARKSSPDAVRGFDLSDALSDD
ncbi:hypothetical protein ABIF65_011656 [Bradyrhizobium japonicum]